MYNIDIKSQFDECFCRTPIKLYRGGFVVDNQPDRREDVRNIDSPSDLRSEGGSFEASADF